MKPHRTYAEVRLDVLARNLKILARVGRSHYEDWKGAVVMVKCDAYGHGMVPVARLYEKNRDALAFGVATLDEAIALRRARLTKPVWVFSDGVPMTAETLSAMVKYRLTPVLHTVEDLSLLKRAPRLPFHLKFNTGLNRLGIDVADVSRVRQTLLRLDRNPEGICTHLASSEDPRAKITGAQLERFAYAFMGMLRFSPKYVHCANSNGMFEERHLGLGSVCNVARPGIGLYGYGGLSARALGLKPALKWRAQVVRARTLSPGASVGYGATFKARVATPESVLSVGYGDGLKRSLSNGELLLEAGRKLRSARVLGRVSMDLCAVNLRLIPGEWVTLLGVSHRQGETMAEAAGTIIYEVLTSISGRVPRTYAMD